MLSTTLISSDGVLVGQNPLIIRLLKGIYNNNPPEPRYLFKWDPEIVLNHMMECDNDSLNLDSMTRKMVKLQALTSLLRTADLNCFYK